MRVLFAEDQADAAELALLLRTMYRHDVMLAKHLCDIPYYLQEEPGADAFDCVFLDLDMSIRDIPPNLYEEARRTYPGWAIYRHVIAPIAHLSDRTALYSGHIYGLQQLVSATELKDLFLINKIEKAVLPAALQFIADVERRKARG